MLVQDMRMECMKEIIELQPVEGGKKEAFQKNEAVNFFCKADSVFVRRRDGSNLREYTPRNRHTKSVLEHCMNYLELCLCEVVKATKDGLFLLVKQYPVCRELTLCVLVGDELIRTRLLKQKRLRGFVEPYDRLKDDSVYSPDGYTEYFVLGRHNHRGKNDEEELVVAAADYFLFIKKKQSEGREYFEAEKISRGIKERDYTFFLVQGRLHYSDEKQEIREKIIELLPKREDSYLHIWNQYGNMEARLVLDRIKNAGVLHFVAYEFIGYGMEVCFFLAEGKGERSLARFAENVKKGDMVSILPIHPFQNTAAVEEIRRIFEQREVREAELEGKIAEDIVAQADRIVLRMNQENLARFNHANMGEGFIFISFKGDKRRLERREAARSSIETMRCPMPELNAILEGRRVTSPKRSNIPALSPGLLEDPRFSRLTPNQVEAIRIALNTPDMAIIQGPPGTGKTTVITAIIKRLEEEADLEGGMFGRSLVTAFQHDAVQNVTDRLKLLGLPAIKFGKKYSDMEEDALEINATIQHWINEKLAKLNRMHADVREMEYMSEFNRLYVNYMKSAVSLEQTLDILKKIREQVGHLLSVELNDRLSAVINSIRFQIKGEDGEDAVLIKAIRRIPTNEEAMRDNGRGALRIAVKRLEKVQDDYLSGYIDKLGRELLAERADYELLKSIKRDILVHIIPMDRIFTGQGKREEIDTLLCGISSYLQNQMQAGKKGEDLVFLEYMQALEENPFAVKKAILEYSVVNGATNQQVMSKEISALKNNHISYDNVLIDEAARSNPLDLFIPMSVARNRIILVGDHRQLPHIVDEEIVKRIEEETPGEGLREEINEKLRNSMFQQLLSKLRELEKQEPAIPRVILLDRQFRMHPAIGSFINRNFYEIHGENVKNGIEAVEGFSHALPGIENKACVWYDTPLALGRERAGKSKSRYVEARRIAGHLKYLLDSPEGKSYSYGIITFYREQEDCIMEALSSEEIGIFSKGENGRFEISPAYWRNAYGDEEYIKVGTVDAFQGREFDVVYLSIVRSNVDEITPKPADGDKALLALREKELRKKYGFLMFENRLCVAMSRGKKVLICVGDGGMVKGDCALEAIPALVDFYHMCNGGNEYGCVIK